MTQVADLMAIEPPDWFTVPPGVAWGGTFPVAFPHDGAQHACVLYATHNPEDPDPAGTACTFLWSRDRAVSQRRADEAAESLLAWIAAGCPYRTRRPQR